jgi:hypothetical protein
MSGECHFSNKILIDRATLAPMASRWRYKDFVLGYNTALELPMCPSNRKILAKKMMSWHPPENVAVYFLVDAVKTNTNGFLYRVACSRLRQHMPGLVNALKFMLYRLLFINPKLGLKIVHRMMLWAKKRGVINVDIDEILAR